MRTTRRTYRAYTRVARVRVASGRRRHLRGGASRTEAVYGKGRGTMETAILILVLAVAAVFIFKRGGG